MVKNKLVFLVFSLLLVLFLLVFNVGRESDYVLTTNLDIENKEILSDNQSISVDWSGFYYLYDQVLLNLSAVHNSLNPAFKYIHIPNGLRKEEIASRLAESLSWDQDQIDRFLQVEYLPGLTEGYYRPGTYQFKKDDSPELVARSMFDRFKKEIEYKYSSNTKSVIKLDTALKIASLIEREAAGRHDMKLISGIIWNRVFGGMSLDIDATLQYMVGDEKKWWPIVSADYKYIDSPYNTYKYKGFPPTPIANPSLASIEAALNPQKTDCLFYLHDRKRVIHCAKTYDQHKNNISKFYARN